MYSRYEHEVKKYRKKDAIIALCVYLFAVVLVTVWWFIALAINAGEMQLHPIILQFALPVIVITTVLTIIYVKKQGLASIGFHKDKMQRQLGVAILFVVILLSFGVVPGLIYGWSFNNLGITILYFFAVLIGVAYEDILFVGYLQPRLYAIFKKDIPAILVGASLFALIHIPVAILGDTIGEGLTSNLIYWLIGHTTLVLIFRLYFSILPVIIVHTLTNFFLFGFLWGEFNEQYNTEWAITAIPLILLILIILEIIRMRRKKLRRKQITENE